jgi:hypothetical protein
LDVDKASASIDRLIEQRAQEREQANFEATAWRESVKKYNARRTGERRAEWCAYHRRMVALFEDLAEQHRSALGALVDGAALENRR